MKIQRKYLYALAAIVCVIALLYLLWPSITGSFATGEGKMTRFAKCLTEKGVVMYSSKYCTHCRNQKKMFGDAFKYVTYVECTESTLCQEKGIRGVPTWEIDGKMYTGERPLETISYLSGCPLE